MSPAWAVQIASSAVRRLPKSSGNACQNAMIRQGSTALADHVAAREPLGPWTCQTLSGRLGPGGNRCDCLQNLGRDLVGVALRVRTTIFQIAFVAVVDKGMRHADRGAAVGDTPAKGVDRGGLVLAGQAHVVVRTIDGDVVGAG